ncbi:unnamed protein product, partial [Polarella glacialis]
MAPNGQHGGLGLSTPLLQVDPRDVEAGGGSQASSAAAARHWARALQGCAPLLPQLPTDELGPVEQHREAEAVAAKSVATVRAGPPLTAADDSLGSTALLVAGFAALVARYAQASEVSVGLWRKDAGGVTKCLPLRISLLRQPGDTSPPVQPGGEEESSCVIPLGSFTSPRCLVARVAAQLTAALATPANGA